MINNKSYEEYSGLDDSFFENMNVKVNNQNCFQKKLYNYFIKKPNKKIFYIDKINLKRKKKEKPANHNSLNYIKKYI